MLNMLFVLTPVLKLITNTILSKFLSLSDGFIDLPIIFRGKSIISSIATYFRNTETPIICYKYNKPVRSIIFNVNKLVSDLNMHANLLTPEVVKTHCIAIQ